MILCWILFIPFIGGLLCWQLERQRVSTDLARWVALVSTLSVLALALWLWASGHYTLAGALGQQSHWQQQFQLAWIPRFGISFHLALDGLSVIMLLLAGVMGLLAVGCSWRHVTDRAGLFYMNLLWIIGGVIGIFLAIDLFLYFFFWEMMLIPMYFLIALWGHEGSTAGQRQRAAIKFFIYTQTSGLLMLLSILGLVFAHYAATGQFTFDYDALRQTQIGGVYAYVLMLGFFIAFAVKLPTVPLHGWQPDMHANSPTHGSVDLTGILVKTAAYGMLRFCLPLFPHASAEFAPVAMILGLIGIYYGAVMAFAQTDMKRLVAYASISHMGFVLIGIYAATTLALQGVIVQILASAISTAGLFLISGQLYERLGTRDMSQLGGLFGRVGALGGFALVFVVASLGMPATANFLGEFLILFGAFANAPWIVVFATLGLILAAIYALILMHRVYWGAPASDKTLGGLRIREYGMLLLLVFLTLLIGLYPHSVLSVSQGTAKEIAHWFAGPAAALPTS